MWLGDDFDDNKITVFTESGVPVKDNFTIELQPEIVFIGDKTKKEEELCKILYKKTQK